MLTRFDQHLLAARPVNFYLTFRSKARSRSAAGELLCLGLSGTVFQRERNWILLTSKLMAPRANSLTAMRLIFEDIAWRLNGRYDAWDTEILLQEQESDAPMAKEN